MGHQQLMTKLTLNQSLTVNRLGFGAMRITGPGIWGEPIDRAEAIRVLRRAIELGINFIDTADSYGPFVSEQLIAEALYPYPADLVIATKGGLMRPEASQWIVNGNPLHLRAACEASLKRLKLERIELYQLHRIDPNVALAEQIGVLQDLQTEGKINQIGLSEVNLDQLKHINNIIPLASVQNKYNLLHRQSEDVLQYCTRHHIAFIPWAPLTLNHLANAESPLAIISQQLNVTPTQIVLAWLLHKAPCMLPIPGTSKVAHLEENFIAAALSLDNNTIQILNNINNAVPTLS